MESLGNYRGKSVGLWLGVLVMLLTILLPSPFGQDVPVTAWYTAGLATMMAIWWITEAVPVAVTALLPLIFAPLLGLSGIKQISSLYAHPLIFLFLGGFLLSLAMERSHLHRRIALLTMKCVGTRPKFQIGGLMLVTAFLSMWMSNTATAVMMLPIALSILELLRQDQDVSVLSPAFLLAIAYSASIGGVATLIGTPPNALLAAYLWDTYHIEIGFMQWMSFALPLSCIMLIFTWFWLTRGIKPQDGAEASHQMLAEQLEALGPMKTCERRVMGVFILAAMGWIFRVPLAKLTGLAISDTTVAMVAGLLLFLIPCGQAKREGRASEPLLTWPDCKRLPWGVLLLFGGGLALAGLMRSSGLATLIGESLGQASVTQLFWVVGLITLSVVFLTEITSNTATTAGFLPLLGPIAVSLGYSAPSFVIPAALAASCAFMMPVATPPNAIVFASGELTIRQMAAKGLVLNFVATIVITCFSVWLLPIMLGL